MEIVKLRMQLQGETGVSKGTGATISELGMRGLYRGVAACWLRDIPFSFLFFPLFAHMKHLLNGNDSIIGLFTAGAIAGSVASGAVTPADVIKTRLQVKGGSDRYKGTYAHHTHDMACSNITHVCM
jgi:solute carrier family 25 aspartate/glutamate transporter 12/13